MSSFLFSGLHVPLSVCLSACPSHSLSISLSVNHHCSAVQCSVSVSISVGESVLTVLYCAVLDSAVLDARHVRVKEGGHSTQL
jgi:hypothetical protein